MTNGSRDERLLMRQRGAGTRQVKSSGFDLVLPSQSKTPLKPRKSGKIQKTPLPKLAPLRSSRRTPKLANAKIAAKPKTVPTLLSNKPADIDDEDDLLASSGTGKIGTRPSTNKRKFADDGKIREGTKKARINQDNENERPKAIKRGRPTQQKPATSAYDSNPLENVMPVKNNEEKELSYNVPTNEDPSVPEEHLSKRQVNVKFLDLKEKGASEHLGADVDYMPKQQKTVMQSKATKVTNISKQIDSVPSVSVDTAEASTDVAPPKRRKKRRSIGQQSMRAKKRPSSEAKMEALRTLTTTSPALMNEPPGFHHSIPKERLPDRTPSLENKAAHSVVRYDEPSPELALGKVETPSEVQAPQEQQLLPPEPQINQKPRQKPRKKRKPIAQVRKPKKPLKRDDLAAVPTVEAPTDKHKDTSSIRAPATADPPQSRPRKPLTNVTNVVKAPKAKSLASNGKGNAVPISRSIKIPKPDHPTVETRRALTPPELPPGEERETHDKQMNGIHKKRSELPLNDGAPKKRGRPRKQPQTAPPLADVDHPAKPQTISKPSKRPPKTSKPPTDSVPITVYRPAPTDDSDSDDPLSLSAYYPRKKAPNAIDMLAQASLEILEKQTKKEDVSVETGKYAEDLREKMKERSALVNENEVLRKAVRAGQKEERKLKRELGAEKGKAKGKGREKERGRR